MTVAKSALIVVFLALVVTANVPVNGVHRALQKVDDPVLAALGPRQVWNVFAPDPPQATSSVAVRFTYRDGSRSSWSIARGNPFVHGYADYRWLKLAENAALSQQAGTGLLLWAARERSQPKPLARAELVRTTRPIAPPGQPRDQRPPASTQVILALKAGS